MAIVSNSICVSDDNFTSLEAFIEWYMEEINADYDVENDEAEDYDELKSWCAENGHYIVNLKPEEEEVVEGFAYEYLIEESNRITKVLLDSAGYSIDKVCEIIKSYQQEYLAIEKVSPNLARKYTFEIWCNRHCDEIFKLEKSKFEISSEKFLISQSNKATKIMLEGGIPIYIVCKLVKSYQQQYLAIKESDPYLSKHFTYEMFVKRNYPMLLPESEPESESASESESESESESK